MKEEGMYVCMYDLTIGVDGVGSIVSCPQKYITS
jgi:hypothetical protein